MIIYHEYALFNYVMGFQKHVEPIDWQNIEFDLKGAYKIHNSAHGAIGIKQCKANNRCF